MKKEKIDEFQGKFRFLSNFWFCNIYYNGIRYPSVEHAYQAQKTLDEKTRHLISKLSTSGKAKKYSKNIQLRGDWEEVKLKIMEDLVRFKFNNNEELKQKLLETDNMELIEGNIWGDTFWGICKGKGENHLGKIIMKIRGELRN